MHHNVISRIGNFTSVSQLWQFDFIICRHTVALRFLSLNKCIYLLLLICSSSAFIYSCAKVVRIVTTHVKQTLNTHVKCTNIRLCEPNRAMQAMKHEDNGNDEKISTTKKDEKKTFWML